MNDVDNYLKDFHANCTVAWHNPSNFDLVNRIVDWLRVKSNCELIGDYSSLTAKNHCIWV